MQNIVISFPGNEKAASTQTFPVDAFAGVKPEFAAQAEKPQFVVGLDAAGQVHRVVSQSETDRAVVAALVGTWIASGLRIQYADGFVALAKLVRKAAAAERGEDKGGEDKGAVGEPLNAPLVGKDLIGEALSPADQF